MAKYDSSVPFYARNGYDDYPNSSQTFYAYVDKDGNIIKTGRDKNTIVGGDNMQIDELRKRAEKAEEQREEFYNKLVEHGIIEVPKTPEQEAMEKVLAELASVKSELKSIKRGNKNETVKRKSGRQTKKRAYTPKVQKADTASLGTIERLERPTGNKQGVKG